VNNAFRQRTGTAPQQRNPAL